MRKWTPGPIAATKTTARPGRAGKFKDEMMELAIPQPKGEPKLLNIDEQYRPDVTMERLAKLPGIYGCKGITAGNAPGLNDGATAILFMTGQRGPGVEP